jgi:hydroxymethylglutaryl-CoA lyase
MLKELGIETDINLETLVKSAQFIEAALGKQLNSRQMEILRAQGKEQMS